MSANSQDGVDGPGAIRVAAGTLSINPRDAGDRITLVLVNTGDRPVQLGSHLHLPDCNVAIDFDRDVAQGFRLDIPAGTSVRFEPGVSRVVDAVRLAGRQQVPGIQIGKDHG